MPSWNRPQKAQGDLARTMDSPTNQLRRLNAEFDMAKIALGQALQPALIAVLPHDEFCHRIDADAQGRVRRRSAQRYDQ